jgi:hypothetical protein
VKIGKLDFVGVPSTDLERSWAFYVDKLGLRADETNPFEFWVGLHNRYAPRD